MTCIHCSKSVKLEPYFKNEEKSSINPAVWIHIESDCRTCDRKPEGYKNWPVAEVSN